MISDLRRALTNAAEHGPNARLVQAVLVALPEEGQLVGRGGVAGLLSQPVSERSIQEESDGASAASDIAVALDRGDLLSAVAVGPRVALSLYDAHLEWALGVADLEQEQARDAAIRLHAIGLLAQRLFDGSTPERAGEMLSYEAGRALMAWFIAVELVLAGHTEDEPVTVQNLRDLMDQHGESAVQELSHLASRADREGGQEVIRAMLGVIGPVVTSAADAVAGIAGAVRRALPELADNSQDALAAERVSLPVYTLLVARLVAEIEAERLELALPSPPPVPEVNPDRELAEAALKAACDKRDEDGLEEAEARLATVNAALEDLADRAKAHKKTRQASARRHSRTVDRRARIAEAPPAGQAEAEAAVSRCEKALRAAEKAVVKAGNQQGTSEEGVVAAKAAVKRWTRIVEERRLQADETQAAVDAIEDQITALRAQDEAQLSQIKKAEATAAQAQAQAEDDMRQRLVDAAARIAAIDEEAPHARAALDQLTAQREANSAALSDLAGSREELADALVLAREAQPERQAERKDRADVLAHAAVQQDSAHEQLKVASGVFRKATSACGRAQKVADRARERVSVTQAALDEARQGAGAADDGLRDLQSLQAQGHKALQANEAAQVAMEAAAVAARGEARAALQRALDAATQRRVDLESRTASMQDAMGEIQSRLKAHAVTGKEHGMRRDEVFKSLSEAKAQRVARVTLGVKQEEQVLTQDNALADLESELAKLVKVSRKSSAAHAGAAARVVGARDVFVAAKQRFKSAEKKRAQSVQAVAELEAGIAATHKELDQQAKKISAAESAVALDAAETSEVENLLAEMSPTLEGENTEKLKAVATWEDEPAGEDAAATAMFTPEDHKRRVADAAAAEDAAAATVMHSRAKRSELSVEEDDEDEAATEMFSLAQLQAQARTEHDAPDEEDDAVDAATVIFKRPPPKGEET